MLLYQISGALLVIALIFAALNIKVKDEIEVAMRPFKVAEEIAAQKNKVKAVALPKAPQKDKKDSKAKDAENNDDKIEGKDADFRTGRWGTSKNKIEEEEKIERLDRTNPYALEYLARVGNYDAITRYEFSSNRLEGGNYIVFGERVAELSKLRAKAAGRVGEPVPSWIKNEFSLYRFPRNKALSDVSTTDQFFYEMFISLMSQYGAPEKSSLQDFENILSRQEKISSVLAFDRMLSYEWKTSRSNVTFIFASYVGTPYFYISYRDKDAKE